MLFRTNMARFSVPTNLRKNEKCTCVYVHSRGNMRRAWNQWATVWSSEKHFWSIESVSSGTCLAWLWLVFIWTNSGGSGQFLILKLKIIFETTLILGPLSHYLGLVFFCSSSGSKGLRWRNTRPCDDCHFIKWKPLKMRLYATVNPKFTNF